MRVYVRHIFPVDQLYEDSFFCEGVVETVHVQEEHLVLIGLLQFAYSQRTLTELVLLTQYQSVQRHILEFQQHLGFNVIATSLHRPNWLLI